MPIDVQCPACKAKLRVPDSAAGKTGKCKCGQPLKIPSEARPVVAPSPQNMALGSALDSLTANDFQQESPHQKAYAVPKANTNDAKTLKRFIVPGTESRPKLSYTTLGLGTIVAVIFSFLGAIAYLVIGIVTITVGAKNAIFANLTIEINESGFLVAGCLSLLLATLALAGGVGTLMKTPWGWTLTSIYFVNVCFKSTWDIIIRIRSILLRNDLPSSYLVGSIVGAILGAILLVFIQYSLFSRRTRFVCKTDSGPWSAMAVGVGILFFAGYIGAMHMAGVLVPLLKNLQLLR